MQIELIELLQLNNENIIGLEIFNQIKKYLQQKETFGVKTKAYVPLIFYWVPYQQLTSLLYISYWLLINSIKNECFIGLVIKSLHPASIAFSLSPENPYAVCAIIITALLN